MLQSIRDHTQGWIAGVIVALLVLSFGLWGIHSYFAGNSDQNIVAKINGVPITKNQVSATYQRLLSEAQSRNQQLAPGTDLLLKNQALQQLIENQVLSAASIKQQYQISTQQIDDFVQDIPAFQVNGQFSVSRLQQMLLGSALSLPQFLELIKTSLLIDQPRLGVLFTSFALPDEVMNNFALVEQERNIDYFMLPFSAHATTPHFSDTDIKEYYQAHQSDFSLNQQVSVEYIVLSQDDLRSTIKPEESLIKKFYDENATSYSTPMVWKLEGIMVPAADNTKAETIREQVQAGVDFASLIKRYPFLKKLPIPDDKWLALNKIPREWQQSILSLTKRGQVSLPIQTEQGITFLKVLAFENAEVLPYEKVKQQVKDAYINQQAEEKFADLKDKIANITYEHPDSLAPAAKEFAVPVKKTGLFTKDKGIENDISADPKVRETAFSDDVLLHHNNSDVIVLNPQTVVVIRVATEIPSHVLPLDTVKNQIMDRLKTAAAHAKVAELASSIQHKLQQGESTDSIRKQFSIKYEKIGFIGRYSNKVDSAILAKVFDMPKPDAGKPTIDIVKLPSGYAVILFHGLQNLPLTTKSKNEYVAFAEQIQDSEGLLEYQLYKQSQMNRAKVVIY